MFAWASPHYVLDQMTWDQVIFYYNQGWTAKQTEARVHWGTYGMLMNEGNPEAQPKQKASVPIEEVRTYPGYENAYYNENGKLIRG